MTLGGPATLHLPFVKPLFHEHGNHLWPEPPRFLHTTMFCPLLTISHPSQSPTDVFPCKGIVSPPLSAGWDHEKSWIKINLWVGQINKNCQSMWPKRIPELRNTCENLRIITLYACSARKAVHAWFSLDWRKDGDKTSLVSYWYKYLQ